MSIQSAQSSFDHRPRRTARLSIRVPANGYISAAFVGTFFAALAFYLDMVFVGTITLLISVLGIGALAVTDRIVFNGKRIYRTGVISKSWAYLTGNKFWLKPRDVEQIETVALPIFKRGGRVYFRYRTYIHGNGLEFDVSTAGRGALRFLKDFFSAVPEEVLDAVSIEIRDHAAESGKSRAWAKKLHIPSSDVLESSFRRSIQRPTRVPSTRPQEIANEAAERAKSLHTLGNELRVSGSLLQALESFRRAAVIRPHDAWLLFDLARCMQSIARAQPDVRLERRAAALMRLAEKRAGGDGQLLARLGESYFQFGEWERARKAFTKAVEAAGDQFRSIRGLAELALRDGKLAHVVHNFNSASRSAESPAARKWSRGEAEYFSRLNGDDEYMEMELGRVNLLDALNRWKRITLRICIGGLPFIALGLYFEDPTTANVGWIVSCVMLVLWTIMQLGSKAFTARISPELLEGRE